MNTNFLKLLELLKNNNVEFVIVGGLAAVAYGSSQMTQDIDICISLSPNNMKRLKEALKEIHPIHRIGNKNIPFNESGKDLYAFNNIYLTTDYGQIDCLGEITGIGNFNDVINNSTNISIDSMEYQILTLDALIKAKSAINRPKDREAVLILKSIRDK